MNPLTLARDLRRRKARERTNTFVAEGVRTVEELLRSPLDVVAALATAQLRSTPRGQSLLSSLHDRKVTVLEVAERDFASAAETESPQGVLAIAQVPHRALADIPDARPFRIVALDAVQDPGNAGTIVRTAAALGAQATLALPGTVDLWNAKVVRSAMGAHFRHFCLGTTWEDVDAFRRDREVVVWAADASGEPLGRLPKPVRLALIFGNEGSGLSTQSRGRATTLVALPMAGAVESLNVAVAAGIFLYELGR